MADCRPPVRKIIHVDMDAFYASVEQRDDPALKGKPVAVGGGHRGVVAAASYEARKFGVRSAMPSVTAKRRCPDLIFVKPRFDVYRAVSQQIRAIFADYTDLIEPLSLDEAYLDVTEDRRGLGSARAIAEDIRRRIREETGLTASAGVSYCKFIAKLASDHEQARRPVRHHAGARRRVRRLASGRALPRRRPGDGAEDGAARHPDRRRPARLEPAGSSRRSSEARADWYWRICRGIDEREVKPDRPYKSVSAERTFDEDLRDPERLASELERIAGYAWDRIERAEVVGPDRDAEGQVRRFHDRSPGRRASPSPVPDFDSLRGGRTGAAVGASPACRRAFGCLALACIISRKVRMASPSSWDSQFDDRCDIKLSHEAAAIQLRP